MQRFKENDPTESDVYGLFLPSLEALGLDRNSFFTDAYLCTDLGGVLYDLERDPLVNVVSRAVYRDSFPALHDLFTRPGTFEFYLALFRKIFADDADITFTIPGPGQLNINVEAITEQNFNLMARRIESLVYIYEQVITSDTSDKIQVQGIRGIKTQAEMDSLTVEISVYGIFTTITLILP